MSIYILPYDDEDGAINDCINIQVVELEDDGSRRDSLAIWTIEDAMKVSEFLNREVPKMVRIKNRRR